MQEVREVPPRLVREGRGGTRSGARPGRPMCPLPVHKGQRGGAGSLRQAG
ncbi:phage DNA packaging protein J [Streptomyces sp. SMC 277]|uniref:Phage DNA packaging protein J n=1 Tax=Streptomyces antimicrobicus TaxID=2883108 RepID=A0ABS8B570_9ACTN|nr:phage DNA packaging protein J [Streptomyces antimicrobicus]